MISLECIDAAWFDDRITLLPWSGCWIWMGRSDTKGYGRVTVRYPNGVVRRSVGAHRISYELHVAKIPSGLLMCHTCDVTSCVNPNHLYAGTDSDNSKDKYRRGRAPSTRGELNGRASLTNEQVVEIKGSLLSSRKIATAYGVSKTTITRVRAGLTYY